MSARTQLAAALEPLLPDPWKLIPVDRNIDQITKPTVVVVQTEVLPAPNYMGSTLGTFAIRMLDPQTDSARVEDDLDGEVTLLCLALDDIEWLYWTKATKGTFNGYFGYEITVTTTTSKGA